MSDVDVELSFQEALTLIGAIRDYAGWRRSHGLDEDAVMVYAYSKLKDAALEARTIDRDGFNMALKAVGVPDMLREEADE